MALIEIELKRGNLVKFIEGKNKGNYALFIRHVDFGNILFYSMCLILYKGKIERYNTSMLARVF